MISTTILQPPTNGLFIIESMHASIVMETMDSIIEESLVIRIIFHRTRQSLKKIGTMLLVEVALVEDVLVMVGVIRTKATMKGTSLE